MSTRNRVENRAQMIYDLLVTHLGEKFSIHDLCGSLSITDGSTTRSALRRARDMATEAGYHFPPAVPQNGHTYTVTDLPAEALDPSLHMARIENGVRARKEDGTEFMRREMRKLPPDLRPIVGMHLKMYDRMRETLADMQKLMDDAVIDMVKHRRETR